MLFHVFHLLVLDAGTFCLCCCLFCIGTLFAEFLVFHGVDTASTSGILGQETMQHQVGVSSYGRCEMCIVLEGQAIVSDIVHAIPCLHHGTQGYHLYDVLFGLAVHIGQHLVKVLGYFSFGTLGLQTITEFAYEVAQSHQFGWVGYIVDSVRYNLCFLVLGHLANALCYGTIG